MKVLLINSVCKQGSTGKIVYDLYTELRKEGHKASICYGRGSKIHEQDIFKFGLDIETYFHALMTRLTGLTGYFSFFSTLRLLKFIKKFKPDVVHIHEFHAYFVNLAPVIIYLKKNNIKTVWTFHCEFMYTGKCGHALECERWKDECGRCPRVRAYPKSMLFDFTKKMLKGKKRLFEGFLNIIIVTPSKWLSDRVKHSFLGNRDIRVIHNGIDTEKIFYPRTLEKLKVKYNITDEKIVLAVAPKLMSEYKGGKWVLDLAKRLHKEKIKFILIGVEDLSEKFENNVLALKRTENQQELAEYYSLADIFVICSKIENFPTTCIENLSCGTPICGFDVGGTKETAPCGSGIFVPYGDIDALEKAIRSVFDGSRQLKTKNECAQYGKENYDRKVMYKNYLEIYMER